MMMDTVQDNRPTQWGWFYYRIIDEFGPIIKADGVAVYMVLVRHASQEARTSYPAIATIAQKIGLSERQVRYTMDRLIAAGLIAVEPRMVETAQGKSRQTSNLYRLLPLPDAPPATLAAPALFAGDPLQPLHPPPARVAAEQESVNENQKEASAAPAPGGPDRPIHPVPLGTPVNQRPDAPPVLPKQPCPALFPVTDAMRAWAATHTPEIAADVDAITGLFVAHYRSKGERRADWAAAWEGFMWRKLEDYRAAHPRAAPARPAPLQLTPYQERAAARRAAQAGAL